ncbi:peptide chain release factor 1 [Candidatus Woesearchaeota archaeon]|nr:peptide chain release factor 1 [Candidatus Woesearchaeota archaeon]
MSDKSKEIQMNAKQRHKLKSFIKELENFKGRHTELVSVYVPSGYDMNKIISHLSDEQGTATNIKSKHTKDNVIAALEKMIQHLRLYDRTPPHGVVVFAGNVSEREGQQDYQVWSLEPPVAMNQRLYRCDKAFVLDPLRDLAEDKNLYGLVVMDKREGNVALLKGKVIIPLTNTTSAVPGKTRAGGQSAQRYERIREGAAVEFYKRIADYMNTNFLDVLSDLKGIIIGGPGHTKNEFVDGDYINDQLKRKIIGLQDLSYTGDFGLQELLEKSSDLLSEEDVIEEKKLMGDFFEKLSKHENMVSYGKDQVKRVTEMGAVEKLLLSESLADSLIEEFEGLAEPLGSKTFIISVDTREGVQLRDMGGVAAILRYPVE